MRSWVTILLVFCALVAVSALANVAMDTKVFHPHDGFSSWPDWARDFMFRRGTVPIIKIDDGWHLAQAVMFLSFGMAYYFAGRESMAQEIRLYDHDSDERAGWWFPVVVLIGLIVVRAGVHGLIFELLYPLR